MNWALGQTDPLWSRGSCLGLRIQLRFWAGPSQQLQSLSWSRLLLLKRPQGTYTFPHRPGWKACRSGTACWHRGRNTGFPVLPSRSPPSPFPAQDVVNLAAGPQLWHSGDHTFLHEQQGLMGLLLHSQERAQADNVGLCQS